MNKDTLNMEKQNKNHIYYKVSEEKKETSSTSGMQRSVETSELLKVISNISVAE